MPPSKPLTQLPTVHNGTTEYRQLKDLMSELGSLDLDAHALELLLQKTECAPGDIVYEACLVAPLQELELLQSASTTKFIRELADKGIPGNIAPGEITSENKIMENLHQLFHIVTEASVIANLDKHPENTVPELNATPTSPVPCTPDQSVSPGGSTGVQPCFYRLLTTAIDTFCTDFLVSIQTLSTAISRTSRPASTKGKSDLYPWRAIFQLYADAQVFESTSELDRGERPAAESEARLALFAQSVHKARVSSFRIPESRAALQRFLELNARLINFKKVVPAACFGILTSVRGVVPNQQFQHANVGAARGVLAGHAKRTGLPSTTASALTSPPSFGEATAKISHALVKALTETLMTVVPRIDDHLCLICFTLAFKPIRLHCGHLFCVRCLVKMQKQGKDNCPLCRAPTVIIANKSNVDHALMNFMRDWFPQETKEKAKANNRESAQEEMEELGLDTRCVVM